MDNQKEKVTEKVTVQDIVDGVTGMIITGEFQPGSPLREVELCNRFGVSRTPIREALRLLQNNGVVEYIPRCGVQVVELTMENLTHITDLRTAIEVLSAQRAATNVTEEQIQELRAINKAFLESKDANEQGQLDYQLHQTIAKISGNPLVAQYLKDLHTRQALIQWLIPFRPERIPFSYQEHENIIQALEWKDEDLAGKQTEIHFHMSQKSLQNKMADYESKKNGKK